MGPIIAMGGGGFSMEPENPLLDQYVLKQSGKKKPKVCFVSTASGDSVDYIRRFYRAFKKLDCEPSRLTLFPPPTSDLEDYVMDKDIIYVGGGNTKNLVALWKAWELDRIFRKAWEEGKVLAGISAGAICWFEEAVTDSVPGRISRVEGLGFLEGSACPHFDGQEERRPGFHRLLREGAIGDGVAADDGAALHFLGKELKQVVTSRPRAKAYRLQRRGDRVVERELESVYLGEKG
ncbi:MAG: peptidase E [Firmicutes bacterium]|uniref:Peptidase E n=1 Tax=Melghirimyces thermohalophilus TaxID=1236220 RepID=A0A1G6NKV8_9BACL|nr:peptidase E [Melghirimyces thermohalophilus]MDA8352288.1 peptidase E [Bacillota bacterium]SDC68281.1 Peptidase E [Melghirimyces thermohalophilus]